MKSIPLTANKLKLIAIVVMFLDHFVSVFLPANALPAMLLKLAGRTAAPVFCFFIAEGFHYTSNLKKYIARLLVFAAISHLPYNLAFGYTFFQATSVILPLAMGLIALAAIKSDRLHLIAKLAILAACCAVSYRANWFFVAVLWIVMFGVFHGDFRRQIIAFCAIGILIYLPWNLRRYGFNFFNEQYPQWHQLGIFLSIPLLAMYNGSPGKKSLVMKWVFYVFYPAHLILLYLLKQFTSLAEIFK